MAKHDGEQGGSRRETLALLELLALSEAQVKAGRVTPLKEAFKRIRSRIGTWRRAAD